MLGRHFELTADVVLAQLPEKSIVFICHHIIKADSGTEDYTLVELLDMIKEKSNNIAKAVAELEALIGEVEE